MSKTKHNFVGTPLMKILPYSLDEEYEIWKKYFKPKGIEKEWKSGSGTKTAVEKEMKDILTAFETGQHLHKYILFDETPSGKKIVKSYPDLSKLLTSEKDPLVSKFAIARGVSHHNDVRRFGEDIKNIKKELTTGESGIIKPVGGPTLLYSQQPGARKMIFREVLPHLNIEWEAGALSVPPSAIHSITPTPRMTPEKAKEKQEKTEKEIKKFGWLDPSFNLDRQVKRKRALLTSFEAEDTSKAFMEGKTITKEELQKTIPRRLAKRRKKPTVVSKNIEEMFAPKKSSKEVIDRFTMLERQRRLGPEFTAPEEITEHEELKKLLTEQEVKDIDNELEFEFKAKKGVETKYDVEEESKKYIELNIKVLKGKQTDKELDDLKRIEKLFTEKKAIELREKAREKVKKEEIKKIKIDDVKIEMAVLTTFKKEKPVTKEDIKEEAKYKDKYESIWNFLNKKIELTEHEKEILNILTNYFNPNIKPLSRKKQKAEKKGRGRGRGQGN